MIRLVNKKNVNAEINNVEEIFLYKKINRLEKIKQSNIVLFFWLFSNTFRKIIGASSEINVFTECAYNVKRLIKIPLQNLYLKAH